MRPRRTISLLKESVRPTVLFKEARPSRSTTILMATWLATFVLYLFVKPDTPVSSPPQPVANTVPAAVNPAAPPG